MKPKAIFLGALIDIGGTLMGGLLLSVCAAFYFSRHYASFDVPEAMHRSCGLQTIALLLGTAYTVIGGFACGRLAGKQVYRNVAVMGLVSTAFGVYTTGFCQMQLADLAILSTTLPAALIGGWLSLKTLELPSRV